MLECVAIAGYVLVHDLGGLGVNTASKVFRENMIAEHINDDIIIDEPLLEIELPVDRMQRVRDIAYRDLLNTDIDYWLEEDMCCIDMGCK